MADQSRIDCKCGYSYLTTSISSNCPQCGKTNWTAAGGMIIIAFIIALVIFVLLIAGSISWAYYCLKNKLNKWHSIGSLALGIVSILAFSSIYKYREYPIMSIIAYLLNTLGVLLSIYNLFKLNQNENKI
jgi:hypothetical protein